MRVVIKTDMPLEGPAAAGHAPERSDRRDTEAAGGDISAQGSSVLRGFLSSLSEGESPFSIIGHKLWSAASDVKSEPIAFASHVDVAISQGTQDLDRLQYEDFAAGLAKLLEREPGDALCAELQITSTRFPGGRQGLALRILLVARGAGRDQAQLRWSLGLARVQQALLFEARGLRQGRF